MAKTSKAVKSKKAPKYQVRHINRCELCGRPRSYIRYLVYAGFALEN